MLGGYLLNVDLLGVVSPSRLQDVHKGLIFGNHRNQRVNPEILKLLIVLFHNLSYLEALWTCYTSVMQPDFFIETRAADCVPTSHQDERYFPSIGP